VIALRNRELGERLVLQTVLQPIALAEKTEHADRAAKTGWVLELPALRALLVDWPTRAQDVLARFRVDYGHHVGDSYFVELVERLKAVSPEFAEWWPRHDIRPMAEACREYNHPLAGRMLADSMTFLVADNPELRVSCHLPVAEANSISKMRRVIAAFGNGARPKPVH